MKPEEPLATVAEDRAQVEAIVDLLDRTTEPATRAELAAELVRAAARYQDIKERALYPALHDVPGSDLALEGAGRHGRAVREAMSDVHRRTKHVEPAYVHAGDPDGFEQALAELVEAVRHDLAYQDRQLVPLVDRMGPDRNDQLRHQLAEASAHASSHPDPPHGTLGRALVTAVDAVERNVHDRSTPWHPGLAALAEGDHT